ncbi:MAG: MFS transporter [Planctomycetes bacterium]|nr:MFS transporter [Planctomycetota bacterium]
MLTPATETADLSRAARWAVLAAAFSGLVFDGFELGLMPVASNSVTISLLAANNTEIVGKWFAYFTAALMLGAAVGGSLLGNLGDRIGRARAMGVSILFYSLFAGLGAFVTSCQQMLVLRFLVGLGVGGMWPNGVALVAECWPNTSRPTVSGVLGAGINVGIVGLSVLGSYHPITPDSWRWIFKLAAIPAILGLIVLTLLPESPKWLASRGQSKKLAPPLRSLFRGELLRPTLIGILLASIPLVGAWAGSKWMIPWADEVGRSANADYYKSTTQWWWAIGATAGSFVGAPLAALIGRRLSYFLISLGATALTWSMFKLTAPLEPSFLPTVFAQGFVATLFFGWLPLYLPELFAVQVRATGAGLSMNIGRFVTAAAVLLIGAQFKGDFSDIGAVCALIYALGMIVVFWAPNTTGKTL